MVLSYVSLCAGIGLVSLENQMVEAIKEKLVLNSDCLLDIFMSLEAYWF